MTKFSAIIAAAATALSVALVPGVAHATTTYTPNLVKQFNADDDNSFAPRSIVPFTDTQAVVELSNGDLWLTDGTSDGTVSISQDAVDAGLDDWSFYLGQWGRLAVSDGAGNLYFRGLQDNNWNIWKFDGTDFTQVSTDNFDYIYEIYLLDGNIYLWGQNFDYTYAGDTLYEVELPSGDVTEIAGGNNCDGAQSEAREVSLVNGLIVFANDETNNCNYGLWAWDPASPGVDPIDLSAATDAIGIGGDFAGWDDRYVWNDELYFSGRGSDEYFELWATDGTVGGTHLVKDINSAGGSAPGNDTQLWFTEYNGELYFAAEDVDGYFMYKTDGTAEGTVPAVTSWQYPNELVRGPGVIFDDRMIVSFNDPDFAGELFLTDGTDAGTTMLKDINESGTSLDYDYYALPVVFDDHIFFNAYDGTTNGGWVSDGTTAGTVKFTDFAAVYAVGDSNEFVFTQVGSHLLFGVSDYSNQGGTGEMALYSIDAQDTDGGLANTGVDATGIALGGIAALVAGVGIYAVRRRARAY